MGIPGLATRPMSKMKNSDPDLQLLIKPSGADCNQACRYCFYRGAERPYDAAGPHRMSDETLQSVVRRYLRLRLPQSVFCWQGGEPTLMGLDFFRRAVQYMERYGVGGQSVSNALQTNGLLLDGDWCAFFRRYRFLVGLSLDGPRDVHDAYRTCGGERGSHAEVLRKLRLLTQEEVEFNILTVVTDVNVGRAAEIYRYLRELGITYMQFIPCLETDSKTLAPSRFSVGPEAFGKFLCELFEEWLPEATAGVSIRLFDGLIRRELTGNSGLCYLDGACGWCPVVEYNGDVYPCDFFVQPEWRLGNIAATPLERLVRRGRARMFRGARHLLPEACAECELADLCRGGCLKDRVRVTGSLRAQSWFCRAYQRFFAHAMEPIRRLAAEGRARFASMQVAGRR